MEKWTFSIRIDEGRYFPRIPQHGFVIQCEFLGELKSSSAVFNTLSPNWSETLVFTLSRNTLLEMKRSPVLVKVQVFAVDEALQKMRLLGYIPVDLRQAQFYNHNHDGNTGIGSNESVWKAVTHCSLYRKPEVAICSRIYQDVMLPSAAAAAAADVPLSVPVHDAMDGNEKKNHENADSVSNTNTNTETDTDTDTDTDSDSEEEDGQEEEKQEDMQEQNDESRRNNSKKMVHFNPINNENSNKNMFRLSIRIKSITGLVTNAAAVYFRYSYPHFGVSGPVITHPAIQVTKGVGITSSVPNGYTYYEFSMTNEEVRRTLNSYPLEIEVMSKEKHENDILFGIARFKMTKILDSELKPNVGIVTGVGYGAEIQRNRIMRVKEFKNIPIQIVTGRNATVRDTDRNILLRTAETSNDRKMKNGSIDIEITLEELGSMPLQQHVQQQQQQEIKHNDDDKEEHQMESFEKWKKEEEERWCDDLRRREELYMKSLGEEWKRREQKRLSEIAQQKTQLTRMEEQLKQALVATKEKEEKAIKAESEAIKLKEQLNIEQSKLKASFADSMRRVKEEIVHQLNMERASKTEVTLAKEVLENRLAETQDELLKYQERFKRLEEEFQIFKQADRHSPQAVLEQQNQSLTTRLTQVEKELEVVQRAKNTYKNQLAKALCEISRLQQEKQLETEKNMNLFKSKLENQEKQRVVDNERYELSQLRKEVELLRLKKMMDSSISSQIESQAQSHSHLQSSVAKRITSTSPAVVEEVEKLEKEIVRLQREKSDLLDTKVYDETDRIIKGFDNEIILISKKIQQLLSPI